MSRSPITPGHPSSVAVLCVECQNGMLGPETVVPALAADCAGLVTNLRRLLDAARNAGVRVVHATYEGTLGGTHSGTARLWKVLGPAIADWAPGVAATQVLPELLAPTDLVVPRHHGLYPTLGTELLPVLKNLGVRTVVLTGVSLNVAVTFTAAQVTQDGFELVVPRDAVGGTPAAYAQDVLNNTIAALGYITTVDALVAEWAHAATSTPGRA